MFLSHRIVLLVTLLLAAPVLALQLPQAAAQLSGEEITERVAPAVVLILVGQGGEQPTGIASGVILRTDGTLFTAYHVVKEALQVQVRLENGEIYDEVELVGFDERRDVAALRIAATGLAALTVAPLGEAEGGEAVYVISNPRGLGWSVSSGVLSGVRLADEVPGAGSGYRVLQFTAPISPGSSGGVVVNAQGQALGIVVGSETGGQNLNFAVPVESVVGLAEGRERIRLGSGRALAPEGGPELRHRPAAPPSEAAAPRGAGGPPRKIFLERAGGFGLATPMVGGEPEQVFAALEAALIKHPTFQSMGLEITRNRALADLVIELGYSWWDFTFSIIDPRTGTVVAAGKEIALDEIRAAPGLAKKIMARLKAKYGAPGEDKPRKKD